MVQINRTIFYTSYLHQLTKLSPTAPQLILFVGCLWSDFMSEILKSNLIVANDKFSSKLIWIVRGLRYLQLLSQMIVFVTVYESIFSSYLSCLLGINWKRWPFYLSSLSPFFESLQTVIESFVSVCIELTISS